MKGKTIVWSLVLCLLSLIPFDPCVFWERGCKNSPRHLIQSSIACHPFCTLLQDLLDPQELRNLLHLLDLLDPLDFLGQGDTKSTWRFKKHYFLEVLDLLDLLAQHLMKLLNILHLLSPKHLQKLQDLLDHKHL